MIWNGIRQIIVVVLMLAIVTKAATNDELLLALEDLLEAEGDPFLTSLPTRTRFVEVTATNTKFSSASAKVIVSSAAAEHSTLHASATKHKVIPTKKSHHGENEEDEVSREQLALKETDPVGTSAMFVVGLITTSLNFVSCGYLLTLVYNLSRKVGFHTSLRLLSYSVIFDMFVGAFFTLSIVYSTLFNVLITGIPCQMVGFVISLLTASDMLLITFVGISTYTKVVHHYEIPHGRWDWILLIIVLGIPLIASGILANFHAFGPESLWCFLDDDSTAGKVSTLGLIVLYFMTGIVVGVCYFLVRRHSKLKPDGNLYDYSDSTLNNEVQSSQIKFSKQDKSELDFSGRWNLEELESKEAYRFHRRSILVPSYAEVKLETHLLIHFLQYTPPCFHLIAMFSGYRTAWVFTLAILSTNLGGVFQLWAYLHHQKKKRSHFKQYYQSSPKPQQLFTIKPPVKSQVDQPYLGDTLGPLRNSSYQIESSNHQIARSSYHHRPNLSAISSNSSFNP